VSTDLRSMAFLTHGHDSWKQISGQLFSRGNI